MDSKVARCKLINLIMRFHPFYDAYFAILKHNHQYWFGVLLIKRVIQLVSFVSAFSIPQTINLLLIFVMGVILIFYIAVVQPYKSAAILTLTTTYHMNLTLLSGFTIACWLSNKPNLQMAIIGVSTGLAFAQYCGTILYVRDCKKQL